MTPSPHHPIGAKGVGESATVGSPAVYVNAVVDALWDRGVHTLDMPVCRIQRDYAVQGGSTVVQQFVTRVE